MGVVEAQCRLGCGARIIGHEEDLVAHRLDESRSRASDDIGAHCLEPLHECREVGIFELPAQASEPHQVSKTHRAIRARLADDFGPRQPSIEHGRELSAPGVVEQALQRADKFRGARDDALDHLGILGDVTALEVLLLDEESAHRLGLPVGKASRRLSEAARQDDGGVIVEEPALDQVPDDAECIEVGLREGRGSARVGEAERPPQGTREVIGDAGQSDEVLASESLRASQDDLLESLGGIRCHRQAAPDRRPAPGCAHGDGHRLAHGAGRRRVGSPRR